jgi:hypothetical protein
MAKGGASMAPTRGEVRSQCSRSFNHSVASTDCWEVASATTAAVLSSAVAGSGMGPGCERISLLTGQASLRLLSHAFRFSLASRHPG